MTFNFRSATSFYAPATGRFDGSARALTEDELRELAPSIFAVEAHASRSERFRVIPTIEILRGLQKEGFSPVGAKQSSSRDATKYDFTKHMIRLRRLDDGKTYQAGDSVAEIILKNANDGTSAYDLMSGLFRIICQNSLVAQTATLDSVKVRHSGDAVANVIEGTYRVLSETEKVLAAPQDWSRLQLSHEQRQAFAEAAHVVRFGDAEGNVKTAIKPEQLLEPRRREDAGRDLWTTFNVAQENAMRGGLRGRNATTFEGGRRQQGRRVTTRPVNGIDQDVKLNKALWVLAERLAGHVSPLAAAA
ncbi:MAG: DUF945 domain-containing protein [Hyphomicrobiales bacterium]|nr:DUF945 domain-containing protein [Hyphomicrobiales bacterium]